MCVCERERMKYSSNPAGKEMNNNVFYIFIVQNVFHFTFMSVMTDEGPIILILKACSLSLGH